jgi:hypothetical protein
MQRRTHGLLVGGYHSPPMRHQPLIPIVIHIGDHRHSSIRPRQIDQVLAIVELVPGFRQRQFVAGGG